MPILPRTDTAVPRTLSRLQFQALTALGAAAIVLVIANGVLFTGNRATQEGITARAQLVQQTVSLEQLQRDIARTLADLALRTRDRAVLDMLAANNVTVTPNAPAAAGAPSGPASPSTPVPR